MFLGPPYLVAGYATAGKHSSRMCTACLCRPYVLQQPPDVSTGGGGVPEVNEFEQVSTDGHQMSLVARALYSEVPVHRGPMHHG